jgi:hypothetical protein
MFFLGTAQFTNAIFRNNIATTGSVRCLLEFKSG